MPIQTLNKKTLVRQNFLKSCTARGEGMYRQANFKQKLSLPRVGKGVMFNNGNYIFIEKKNQNWFQISVCCQLGYFEIEPKGIA